MLLIVSHVMCTLGIGTCSQSATTRAKLWRILFNQRSATDRCRCQTFTDTSNDEGIESITWEMSDPYQIGLSNNEQKDSLPASSSLLTMGRYIKSNSSKIIHKVLMALFNTEVYATSNVKPASFKYCPPWAASFNPFSFKEASAHPVKMFMSFHSDSP